MYIARFLNAFRTLVRSNRFESHWSKYYLGAFSVTTFCESMIGLKIPYRVKNETLTNDAERENKVADFPSELHCCKRSLHPHPFQPSPGAVQTAAALLVGGRFGDGHSPRGSIALPWGPRGAGIQRLFLPLHCSRQLRAGELGYCGSSSPQHRFPRTWPLSGVTNAHEEGSRIQSQQDGFVPAVDGTGMAASQEKDARPGAQAHTLLLLLAVDEAGDCLRNRVRRVRVPGPHYVKR